MSASQYQPGVCNIGDSEVKRRKQVARFGAAIFVLVSGYLLATNSDPSHSYLAFLPAMIAAVGFVQSRKRFCFAFGLLGTFNFAELGKISKVASKAEISADRRQALIIIAQSIGLALVATLIIAALLAL